MFSRPEKNTAVSAWLTSMRGKRMVKVICGLRGVGKTTALAAWRDALIAEGYPEERMVCLDAEAPVLRRLVTADDLTRFLVTQLPPTGPVTLLIEEPTSFPDYEVVLKDLLGQRQLDIFLTASSRRLEVGELADYLRGAVSVYELMPPKGGVPSQDAAQARARWVEILLRDVLPGRGVADVGIAERLVMYLVDSVGQPISLRSAAAAISPQGKQFSPNTIEAYLTALENAYVLERCYLWDEITNEPLKREYRVFFTDPALMGACFGISSDFMSSTDLNERWLEFRAQHHQVYLAKAGDGTTPGTFVAR